MFFQRKTKRVPWGILCLCAALFSPTVNANPTTQAKAQAEAELLHRKAADVSMQNSTTSAMTALMDLAALNIGGAVSNGYKAYGSYRNSEELDVTADLDNYLQKKMQSSGTAFNGGTQNSAASANAKGAGGITGALTVTDTSFSRLDSSFLRTGKAAEVAAEFERKTGMSREEFLGQLARVSDNKLSASDPQLMDKIVGRFEAFVARIPNQEFKANLEKGIAMIPQTARTGLVAQALQKISSGFVADSSVGAEIAAALAKTDKSESQSSKSAGAVATTVAAGSATPEKASTTGASRSPAGGGEKIENAGFFIGLEKDSADPLANIIQSAMDTQSKEDTIFSQVTRRYRMVTPLLSKTP